MTPVHFPDALPRLEAAIRKGTLRRGEWGDGNDVVCMMSAAEPSAAGEGGADACATAGWPLWLARLNVRLFDADVGAEDEDAAAFDYARNVFQACRVSFDPDRARDLFLIRRLDTGDYSALKSLRMNPVDADWYRRCERAVARVVGLLRMRLDGANVEAEMKAARAEAFAARAEAWSAAAAADAANTDANTAADVAYAAVAADDAARAAADDAARAAADDAARAAAAATARAAASVAANVDANVDADAAARADLIASITEAQMEGRVMAKDIKTTPAADPAHAAGFAEKDPRWTSEWQWWAGSSAEDYMTIGPCATRQQAIEEAVNDGFGEWLDESKDPPAWKNTFHVCECRQDPLRLADWIDADWILERAEESLADSDRVSCEFDDGPWFECTPEQEDDLKSALRKACDDWQVRHNLQFHSNTFSHSRNHEDICTNALRPLEGSQP